MQLCFHTVIGLDEISPPYPKAAYNCFFLLLVSGSSFSFVIKFGGVTLIPKLDVQEEVFIFLHLIFN